MEKGRAKRCVTKLTVDHYHIVNQIRINSASISLLEGYFSSFILAPKKLSRLPKILSNWK